MWDDFELDNAELIPKYKLGLHAAQIVFSLLTWILEIVVLRNDTATVNGQNGWTFAVCFLSVPAWIYLIGTPRFERTRKWAYPSAMLAVDGIFTIIWLSAFATQAAFNTANLCGGACGVSKAVVAMAFFVFLLFGATTFLSIWTLKYFQWNNRLPGYQVGGGTQNIDPDKAAFSMAPHDEEAYAPVQSNDHDNDHTEAHHHDNGGYGDPYGAPAQSEYSSAAHTDPYSTSAHDDPYGASTHNDPYASAAHNDPYASSGHAGYGAQQENPFRPADNPFDSDSEYHGGSHVGGQYTPPSGHGYDDHQPSGPAQFPTANYDRIAR